MDWSKVDIPDDFVLDPKESYARMVIQPLITTEGIMYHINAELVIRPYPNPFKMGGWYQNTNVRTKKQVNEHIKAFEEEGEFWKARGMTIVAVNWYAEAVRVKQLSLAM